MNTQDKKRIAESAIREQEKFIKFKIKPFRIADLVEKYKKNQFYIPDYQRDDVWSYPMKSKFIESVLLGLPIPDIYVCETKEDDENYDSVAQFEVIDGSQRLRSLVRFTENDFYLTSLDTVKELNDLFFKDLTDFRKDKFYDVTINVIILHPDTTEEVKNQMFDRINTSNPLKAMELRRGSHTGPFNDLVRECGLILQNDYSDICPINTYFRNRREEEELVLRYFAFSETFNNKLTFSTLVGERISEFNEGNEHFLTSFYDYMNKSLKQLEADNLQKFDDKIEDLRVNFIDMLSFVRKQFQSGFKRDKSKTVARVVFEAISVGVTLAIKANPKIKEETLDTSWIKKDKDFINSISQKYGLHEANKIIERIEIVKNNLLNQS